MSAIVPATPPAGTLVDDPKERRRGTGALALALVLGLHAVSAMIAAWWIGPPVISSPAEPAVPIDMAPLAAPPVPPAEQPPGPKQLQADVGLRAVSQHLLLDQMWP